MLSKDFFVVRHIVHIPFILQHVKLDHVKSAEEKRKKAHSKPPKKKRRKRICLAGAGVSRERREGEKKKGVEASRLVLYGTIDCSHCVSDAPPQCTCAQTQEETTMHRDTKKTTAR
jgi:hypothetical protein